MTFLRTLRQPTDAEIQNMRRQKAVMNATQTPGGSWLVNCPYCILPKPYGLGLRNPVDVTKFIDRGGKREHTVDCSKRHTLRFKSIDQWREERQRAGIQERV